MKAAKCIVKYDTGKFETDTLAVTSPTGRTYSLWLHKEISEELKDNVLDIILAYINKHHERYDFEKANSPGNTHVDEWSTYIEAVHQKFGRDPFREELWLTYESMDLFRKACEA